MSGAVALADTVPVVRAGYVGRIPVRNLWLLMLYASDLFRARGAGSVGLEDSPDDLPDLIAAILARAVDSRMRKRLSYGYQHREQALNRVRGRIDVLRTERHQLLARGMVACRFDEMTIDTPRNRYVRAALETISRIVGPAVARRCRVLAGDMKAMGVSGEAPTRSEMSVDRVGRHDAADAHMIAAAKLAFDLALPTEAMGTCMLPRPEREETWVRRLFERAVGGFYDVALSHQGWQVKCGGALTWPIGRKTSGIDAILPNMKTDVVLDHRATGRRIVIDTKFTSIVKDGWYREQTLSSGYLYQIYAYLRSQVGGSDPLADRASGLLLHPAIGAMVMEEVDIQGHTIAFATVNLAATSTEIREQLLQAVRSFVPPPGLVRNGA